MPDLLTFDQIQDADIALVGGKALSLAQLFRAGLPVPPGFCLTTAAYRRLRGRPPADDPALVAAVAGECERLGPGPLAIRSSAVGEDGAVASFAGQQETVLGAVGPDAVLAAVQRCWASLGSERAVAYRRQRGVTEEPAMAIVVQRLVPAEAAGVLFTRDPLDASSPHMLVEASWGLGECVVCGRVTPDRFRLDRDTSRIIERRLAVKSIRRAPAGDEEVPAELRPVACLEDRQLAQLGELGRRVEALQGGPRDIEFAVAGGVVWVLQSRPITGGADERDRVRREEVAALRAIAEPRGTVWVRYNLAEVLPAPTPMTWEVLRRHLLSAKGGFGLLYRDLGYLPDPTLSHGAFDLVCGRPYCNLSREPRLYYGGWPVGHRFRALKADPRRALYPTPEFDLGAAPWHFWLTLPGRGPVLAWRALAGAWKRARLSRTFARRYREQIGPAFVEATRAAAREDLASRDDAALVGFFELWTRRTLVDFARDSLKPTALAALALAQLERRLGQVLGGEAAASLLSELVMGVRPPEEADLTAGVRALASGTCSREAFLDRFGHRGGGEMELAAPRWSEDPAALPQPGSSPAAPEGGSIEDRLRREPRLGGEQRALVLAELAPLREYLGLRETAKNDFLRGYALIRAALVELDRRYRLGGGAFFLTPDELPALLRGNDLAGLIAQRRRRRALALGLEAPPVLFSDDLDVIGRPVEPVGGVELRGVPLSAGVAEGPALVLDAAVAPAGDGYILVCPSTDPGWVPLLVQARGLVMETGGALSHGAIVAREFGLPAVAGLPGVMRGLHPGQRLRVDGGRGIVTLLD